MIFAPGDHIGSRFFDELPCPQEQLYEDIYLIVVSCDGTKFLAGTHSNILVWDLPTREFRYSVAAQEHNYHNPFVVTSDSRYLISVLPSHQIGISNVQDGSCTSVLPGHDEPVDFLLLSSTDSTLVSSSRDKTIKVWDLATSRLLYQLKRRGNYGNRISLVMSDRMIADVSEKEGILSLWDLHSGAFLQEISGIKFPTFRNFSFINTKEYAAYANTLLKRESWQSIINRMPTKEEKRFSFFK